MKARGGPIPHPKVSAINELLDMIVHCFWVVPDLFCLAIGCVFKSDEVWEVRASASIAKIVFIITTGTGLFLHLPPFFLNEERFYPPKKYIIHVHIPSINLRFPYF